MRALHEQERLFNKLAENALRLGHQQSAAEYQAKAAQAQAHSQALRALIAARAFATKDETS